MTRGTHVAYSISAETETVCAGLKELGHMILLESQNSRVLCPNSLPHLFSTWDPSYPIFLRDAKRDRLLINLHETPESYCLIWRLLQPPMRSHLFSVRLWCLCVYHCLLLCPSSSLSSAHLLLASCYLWASCFHALQGEPCRELADGSACDYPPQ